MKLATDTSWDPAGRVDSFARPPGCTTGTSVGKIRNMPKLYESGPLTAPGSVSPTFAEGIRRKMISSSTVIRCVFGVPYDAYLTPPAAVRGSPDVCAGTTTSSPNALLGPTTFASLTSTRMLSSVS